VMKSFRDKYRGVCNVQFRLFAIIKKTATGKYFYLIRSNKAAWGEWQQIYAGKKTKVLNKYTLPVICILFNVIVLPVVYIVWVGVLEWIYRYFDGMRNFIRNAAWYQNVRYFTWMTLVALVAMIVLHLITKGNL
jgi:hypothetical protein